MSDVLKRLYEIQEQQRIAAQEIAARDDRERAECEKVFKPVLDLFISVADKPAHWGNKVGTVRDCVKDVSLTRLEFRGKKFAADPLASFVIEAVVRDTVVGAYLCVTDGASLGLRRTEKDALECLLLYLARLMEPLPKPDDV